MELMWENETEKQAQNTPKSNKKIIYKADSRQSKQTKKDNLLAVQCILCITVLAFVFCVSNLNSNLFSQMSTSYKAMMENGISFDGETPILRFVDDSVATMRTMASDWAQNLSANKNLDNVEIVNASLSGLWKSTKKQVPEGASLDSYTIDKTLLQPVYGTLSSEFGFRKNPVDKTEEFHMGIDIAAAEGTKVIATLGGQVVKAGTTTLRGNYIIVHHEAGLQSLYQHLQCSFVKVGQSVAEGEIIGAVGATGKVTGPHLHFELIVNGVCVNPITQFPALEQQVSA